MSELPTICFRHSIALTAFGPLQVVPPCTEEKQHDTVEQQDSCLKPVVHGVSTGLSDYERNLQKVTGFPSHGSELSYRLYTIITYSYLSLNVQYISVIYRV